MSSGLCPLEIWTETKSSYSGLNHAHPWGCPAYVLDPRRQDGNKIPKWQPQSRQAQYLGASPLHASTVGLVRNLRTGNISPQFHVVYDDFFETVHSPEDDPPLVWQELIAFHSQKSEYDDEDYVPELSDEWLTEEELKERCIKQQEERELNDVYKPSPIRVPLPHATPQNSTEFPNNFFFTQHHFANN